MKTPENSIITTKKKAIIYSIVLPEDDLPTIEKRSQECEALLKTYGGKLIKNIIQKKSNHSTHTFIGITKLNEIIKSAKEKKANLILINATLKPSQIYNIEKIIAKEKLEKKITVWDRSDLIISIFSLHAQSANAKLQLELAKLEHFGPRIFGMGEDLSQQGGGIGTRGLGETNTEIMKRHISSQKKRIRNQLKKLTLVRENNRKRRKKHGFKSVSIIGYTNAGKSALFKSLTKKKETLVENKLFATLDTKTARAYLPSHQCNILLSDTIGFIEDLPTRLMDAFRSTLEETMDTNLLLEVVDISDPNFRAKMTAIENILTQLSCNKIPRLLVYNKIDALEENNLLHDLSNAEAHSEFNTVYISAKNKTHLNLLQEKIGAWLFPANKEKSLIEKSSTIIK